MIIITGQTGTGKTSLALKLARETDGVLISADSRQIYRCMDIGTGKVDDPTDLEYRDSIWYLKKVPIYGINLISPDEFFSAGDFADYARDIINTLTSEGKNVILVGGTGFYIKSLVDPDDTVSIPQNKELRARYEQQTVEQQQQALSHEDPEKYASMNNSDRNNPRRLVRALEVAEWKKTNNYRSKNKFPESIQWIGLTATKDVLQKRIAHRVQQMIDQGLEKEVTELSKKFSWSSPGLQTIGYREWQPFFDKEKSLEDVTADIVTSHLQYARKQMVYFKRFPFIEWQQVEQ